MHTTPQPSGQLSEKQGSVLVTLARQTIARQLGQAVPSEETLQQDRDLKDPVFGTERGTFVTLNRQGELRGCMGTIAPVESILDGIRRNAVNAAFGDPRFPALRPDEFADLEVEVSILTDPQPLTYSGAEELVRRLRPGIDGVIVRYGAAGATFLPQVWEQLPRTEDFLGRLCLKAGLSFDAWEKGALDVLTYQVQHFSK